jgi:hypothetical protein
LRNIYIIYDLHCESNKPKIGIYTKRTEGHLPKDIEAKECDDDCFDSSFEKPHEEICIVEDTVLLPNKINLGEKTIEVLVDPELFGKILHLVN